MKFRTLYLCHKYKQNSNFIEIELDAANTIVLLYLRSNHLQIQILDNMKIVFISFVVLYILVLFLELFIKPRNLKVKDLKIGKKKFVELVLNWCINNIDNNGIPVNVKVIYRKSTKRLGYYVYYDKMVVLYIDDSLDLFSIVDSTIHEFIHHLQMPSKKFEKEYSEKLISHGYENHPMEIEARNLAKKYRNQCYDQIIRNIV